MPVLRLGTDGVDVDVVAADVVVPHALEFGDGVEGALRAHHRQASEVAARAAAYGRTTGVGANRDVQADDRDGMHGLRLVRSHATGAGRPLADDVARATMLIRAHQLARPGSGVPFEAVDALRRAANDGRIPVLREFGGIGTGDITGLAALALNLLGEQPWADGAHARYLDGLDGSGALAFMSSSAPTLAASALAAHELAGLLRTSLEVAAVGAVAVRANSEHWSPAAERAQPSPGVSEVCGTLRRLLDGCSWEAARTQDPLSWRTVPFVLGTALDASGELREATDAAISARAENPQYAEGAVYHHGAFSLTGLSIRLDAARLALVQWASTSVARLAKLHDPAFTALPRFLADGPAGSSGTMVLEYTASSALETVRALADPTTRHTASISLGNEDHAPFATRGAAALREQVAAATVVVACELVAAARAVRQAGFATATPPGALVDRLSSDGDGSLEDRPLTGDVDAACRLIQQWGARASV